MQQRNLAEVPVEEYRDFLAYYQEWVSDVGHVVVAPSEQVAEWLRAMTHDDGGYTRPVTHGSPGVFLQLADSWARKDRYRIEQDGTVVLDNYVVA